MSLIFDWIFVQYQDTPSHLIVLEMIGVFFGFLSVWYSKHENILVFPTGIISTGIFVYILLVFGLLGDMLINAYYFSMSVFGWYVWTRKVDDSHFTPVTRTTLQEKKWSVALFVSTILFVCVVYWIFDKFNNWTAYVDTFTTAIFFVGMWLMAKKKLENWIYWIIGDIISVPLYLYKGLIFTSLQFFLFTIIAIYGYLAWKKSINNNLQTS
ncbi:nicotinamide mononucleotide transporter [Maribacter sp. 4U21]|uniref:nicotinamide riboside transporter PnuC n=1 Tax=Maribacter sp. 4U21 TaxID=1889779 RepID=UPI000C15F52C|nr:nicotinamide riboside transporter PnuC [Maribacter sp. 4U21]PIB30876.1 nicotinamide mononucleotide transporter [Maribacter sp. 4U21]